MLQPSPRTSRDCARRLPVAGPRAYAIHNVSPSMNSTTGHRSSRRACRPRASCTLQMEMLMSRAARASGDKRRVTRRAALQRDASIQLPSSASGPHYPAAAHCPTTRKGPPAGSPAPRAQELMASDIAAPIFSRFCSCLQICADGAATRARRGRGRRDSSVISGSKSDTDAVSLPIALFNNREANLRVGERTRSRTKLALARVHASSPGGNL